MKDKKQSGETRTTIRPLNMKMIARSPHNVDLDRMELNKADINQKRQELNVDVNLHFIIYLEASEFNYEAMHFSNSAIELEAVVQVFAYTHVSKEDLLEIFRHQMKSFIPETYILHKEVDRYSSSVITMTETLTGREINNDHDLYELVDVLLKRIDYEIELSIA